jgi:hypothetical protein
MRNNLSLVLVVLVLLLSGCQPANSEASTSPAESADVGGQETIQTEDVGTLTYIDPDVGFSLTYPETWFLDASALKSNESSTRYSVSITSWDARENGSSEIPADESKIEIVVLKEDITPNEAAERQKENETDSASISRASLESGLQGVVLDVDGPTGLTRTLIVNINGSVVYLKASGNLDPFLSIAMSLIAIK